MDASPLFVMGGIGSGKSRLVERLGKRGAVTADLDRFGHQALTEPEVIEKVAARWPEVLVSGQVDRALLGKLVFGSSEQLKELERIVHPRIMVTTHQFIRDFKGPVVLEVSVPQAVPNTGLIVVVDVDDGVRQRRLRARGMTSEQISQRMDNQPSRVEFLAKANLVVNNNGSERELSIAVDRVWSWWNRSLKGHQDEPTMG